MNELVYKYTVINWILYYCWGACINEFNLYKSSNFATYFVAILNNKMPIKTLFIKI